MRAPPGAVSAFGETWAQFSAASEALGPTPGVREAWHRGRPRYAVWVLRVTDDAVRERMNDVSRALSRALGPAPDMLRPQPAAEAHVTVWVAGFPTDTPALGDALDDDVAWARLHAQAAEAAGAGPLSLVVGGANSFLSCAFLEVFDPTGGLGRLRARLGPGELRFAPYLPHVTAALYGDRAPLDRLRAALQPLRALPPLPMVVDALELVTFRAEVAGSPLETALYVPLAGRAGR